MGLGGRKRRKRRKTYFPLTNGSVIGWSVVQKRTRNDGGVVVDDKTHVRKRRVTGKNVSTQARAIRGRRDRAVVILNDTVGEVEECSPGIGNGVNGDRPEAATANRVALAGEFPEPSRVIDGNVGDGACVLGIINEAKVVRSRRTFLQVDREQRARETGFGIVEKRQLLSRLHCIVESVNVLPSSSHKERESGDDDDNDVREKRKVFPSPVLPLLNARPSKPSLSTSRWN